MCNNVRDYVPRYMPASIYDDSLVGTPIRIDTK